MFMCRQLGEAGNKEHVPICAVIFQLVRNVAFKGLAVTPSMNIPDGESATRVKQARRGLARGCWVSFEGSYW